MSKTTNHVAQPSVILFGLTSIGKPKGGAFKPTEAEAARKAAAKLGLQVFEIADESTRAFAAKVPAGQIHGHSDAIVPFVPKALYAGTGCRNSHCARSKNIAFAQRELDATVVTSFKHLVGGDHQVLRDGDAERLSRLDVDEDLKLRGSLHRQITGFLASRTLC